MSDTSGIEPRTPEDTSGLTSVAADAPLTGNGTAGSHLGISAATTGAAGSMSAADKAKLDGITAGATNTPLSSATPQQLGSAAAGSSTSAARDDHVHAHGNQSGGSLHSAVVAAGAAGFMTGADKTKLDALPSALSLPVSAANGGTGSSTLPAHAVLLGNGTSPVGSAAPSTAGQVLTSTGASGDPAFADTITGSNSASVLASAFSITAANGTYAGTGLTVTLPSAGTYLVFGNIRSTVAVSAGAGANISFKLRDTTAGSDVSTSTRIGAYASTTGAAYITTTPIAELISVASSHVIELYAASNTGTTYTARSIDSDTAGYTKLWFMKVSP